LLQICELIAARMSDGHFTLLRFTTGWKCCFFTPEPFRERVWELPAFETASEAMIWAIRQELGEEKPF